MKANQVTTYTKVEVNTLLAPKATTVYVDHQLWLKANKADVIELLLQKANQATTYTITEVDGKLALKANVSDVNAALALKADNIYTLTANYS